MSAVEDSAAHLDVEDPRGLVEGVSVRELVVAWANWGARNAGQIHYAQSRPMEGLYHPGKLPLSVDCSAWVTLCYRWGRAPDPNGSRYNGYGYTGTLMTHNRPIKTDWLRPGDLVTFGAYPGVHVVIMVGSGANGMCVSHGQEAGPFRYPLSRAIGALPGPVKAWRSPDLPLGPWALQAEDLAAGQVDGSPPAEADTIPVKEAGNPPQGADV